MHGHHSLSTCYNAVDAPTYDLPVIRCPLASTQSTHSNIMYKHIPLPPFSLLNKVAHVAKVTHTVKAVIQQLTMRTKLSSKPIAVASKLCGATTAAGSFGESHGPCSDLASYRQAIQSVNNPSSQTTGAKHTRRIAVTCKQLLRTS